MDHNRITEVPPDALSHLGQLTKLNLRDNEIADLCAEGECFVQNGQIRSRDVAFWIFICSFPDLHHWDNLVELDLGSNRLSSLPDELGALKSLEMFRLSYNQLKVRLTCVLRM